MSRARSAYGFSSGLRGLNVRADGNDREFVSGGSNGGSRKSDQYGNKGHVYGWLVNSGNSLFRAFGLEAYGHPRVGLLLLVQEVIE